MQKYVLFGTYTFANVLTFIAICRLLVPDVRQVVLFGTLVFVNVQQISDVLKYSVPNMQKYVPLGTLNCKFMCGIVKKKM